MQYLSYSRQGHFVDNFFHTLYLFRGMPETTPLRSLHGYSGKKALTENVITTCDLGGERRCSRYNHLFMTPLISVCSKIIITQLREVEFMTKPSLNERGWSISSEPHIEWIASLWNPLLWKLHATIEAYPQQPESIEPIVLLWQESKYAGVCDLWKMDKLEKRQWLSTCSKLTTSKVIHCDTSISPLPMQP